MTVSGCLALAWRVGAANKPSVNLMSDYDPANSVWGQPGAPPPALDDASLPFTRGLLTFGSGMGVKMTVTRLQQVRCSAAEGLPRQTATRLQHGGVPSSPVVPAPGRSPESVFSSQEAESFLRERKRRKRRSQLEGIHRAWLACVPPRVWCALQWATSEGGLADTSGLQAHGGLAGAPPALFPLLRAAADLLMMPKELLMEPTIRRDVCQALSIR